MQETETKQEQVAPPKICPVCHSAEGFPDPEISETDMAAWARHVMGEPRFRKTYNGAGGISVTLQTRLPAEVRDVDRVLVRSGASMMQEQRSSMAARYIMSYSVHTIRLPGQVEAVMPPASIVTLQQSELQASDPVCINRLHTLETLGGRAWNNSDHGFVLDSLISFERLVFIMFVRTQSEASDFFEKARALI